MKRKESEGRRYSKWGGRERTRNMDHAPREPGKDEKTGTKERKERKGDEY